MRIMIVDDPFSLDLGKLYEAFEAQERAMKEAIGKIVEFLAPSLGAPPAGDNEDGHTKPPPTLGGLPMPIAPESPWHAEKAGVSHIGVAQ